MALQVEIDPRSGFCGGVIRAISKAEEFLGAHPGEPLYSVGAIVHNEAELERLEKKGLRTVSKDSMPAGQTLLIRAHGEPPATYARARELGCRVIDCTCPVVLQLQGIIREAYARLKPLGGQIVIFGKIGHAEVLGLEGQVDGDVLVVENEAMLDEAIGAGRIDFSKPIEVFSQTTKSPSGYAAICSRLGCIAPCAAGRFRTPARCDHLRVGSPELQWEGAIRPVPWGERADLADRLAG